MNTQYLKIISTFLCASLIAAASKFSTIQAAEDEEEIKKIAEEKIPFKISPSLANSYFCAICEVVDAVDVPKKIVEIVEKLPEADKANIDIVSYRPVKIYWGSLEAAKSSLQLHSIIKQERKNQFLVVFHSENNFVLGGSKTYITIFDDPRLSSHYRLIGKETITKAELMEVLDRESKKMREKFPLDKEEP